MNGINENDKVEISIYMENILNKLIEKYNIIAKEKGYTPIDRKLDIYTVRMPCTVVHLQSSSNGKFGEYQATYNIIMELA